MIPIAYLNENVTNCNEKLAWGKQEPLIHPYVFWYKTKGEKASKSFILLSFHVVIITFKSIQYEFLLNSNIPHLVRAV